MFGLSKTNEKVNAYRILAGKYSIKYHIGDQGVDGRITLRVT
jgi:hypothetical protein